jgi:hypothetical protein
MVIVKHWAPLNGIAEYWNELCAARGYRQVLEVGPGCVPFAAATAQIDVVPCVRPNVQTWRLDIDTDVIPVDSQFYNFAYCRHVLEDIQNPNFAFAELARVSSAGYVETPSPLVECSRGTDSPVNATHYCGYHHHRYIVWTEVEDNSLHFLPKLPLLEHIVLSAVHENEAQLGSAETWNNYYWWDASRPPKCVIYKHGVNFTIMNDYETLLTRAITQSLHATEVFLKHIKIT